MKIHLPKLTEKDLKKKKAFKKRVPLGTFSDGLRILESYSKQENFKGALLSGAPKRISLKSCKYLRNVAAAFPA